MKRLTLTLHISLPSHHKKSSREKRAPNPTLPILGLAARSVRGRSRERRVGNPDAAVGGVEDRVEALEEGHAVDEVEALAAGRADRADDEVHAVRVAPDGRVQRALRGRRRNGVSKHVDGASESRADGEMADGRREHRETMRSLRGS